MECVTLETMSTETGTKDFIAVSTTINRGEDLAVKGAVCTSATIIWFHRLILLQVYVFEVVEVVPDPNMGFKRWYRLKLHCRDEAKGPVTALCGMDNYLVSSMGQKVSPSALLYVCVLTSFEIFVRALDLDERLVGVAFLDVGVYVTSLRTIKNLLIIGDAVKSVWLVAFQVLTTFFRVSF